MEVLGGRVYLTTIVLTEKKEQIIPYATALGTPVRVNGVVTVNSSLLNDEVQFVAANGHLFKLVAPEFYRREWQDRNNYELLPLIPEKFKVATNSSRALKSFNKIKKAISAADEVILATDPDQQGEVIGREILEKIPGAMDKCKLRLLNSSLTATGARRSFENLVPMAQQDHLGEAGELQNHLNWLVGINLSRVASIQLQKRGYYMPAAAGTVKTPTLALIVDNDNTISQFRSQPFWQVQLSDSKAGVNFDCDPVHHFNKLIEAENLKNQLKSTLVIKKVDKEKRRKVPPKLFNLTSLQGYAAKNWGYSGQQVLETLERMYKDLHITSYPRTDSTVIEAAEFDYLKDKFDDYLGVSHWDFVMQVSQPRAKVVVANTGGHPALIPTDKVANLRKLTEIERRLYQAVVDRTLLMFANDCSFQQVEVRGTAGTEQIFVKRGRQYVDRGWADVSHVELTDQHLPAYQVGQEVTVESVILEDKTKVPARITEGQLFDKLFPKYNLGTPATRASILTELIEKNHYVEVKGKQRELWPTDNGRIMVSFWKGTMLTDLKLAKTWQDVFKRVIDGKTSATDYEAQMKHVLKQLTEEYRTKQPLLSIEPKPHKNYEKNALSIDAVCPKCLKGEIELFSPVGEGLAFYGCSNQDCRFTLPTVYCSVAINEPMIRALVQNGQTDWLPKVVSGKGKEFVNKVAFKLDAHRKLSWLFKASVQEKE